MEKGVLINDIELAYAPMSAYHFSKLIKDKDFQNNFFDSHLYIISQRKELTFNNFDFSKELELNFEIWQDNNPNKIKCRLPIIQKNITVDKSKGIQLRLHDRKNTIEKKNIFPFKGTQGFSILSYNIRDKSTELLAWFSPDKLFHNYRIGYINAEFSMEFKDMCDFYVHYVGKSTEQNICQRLSKHSTFQEILTNETPLSYGNIPSNEIMILLFRIKDINTIAKWGKESDSKEISNYLNHYILPSDKIISLDAEKALIKHLQPKYNRVLYNTFPNKNDLINKDIHNVILYGFSDSINLIYDNGIIKGGNLYENRDYISVEQN